ncbi:hypothetical protein HYPBUDRAFT_209681 [Hyphopichia burtonii NRRL Y-1933]|uniref:Major facilitator superfamily (MFS) profile domain-containing protein n=1 Tax=Hyphopichia burtonii NRRL Y-1933 TaxID=984485 RepID=A0A1E4RJM3_9ASCO|nr:hypothetical protein HYPBUDRAFT_209681 [Hyphopichia burtonii NRRL Y-1933]ODV67285.1 hypothetical protein HYPBUDRAFT_209681 [Hyphopichia burtonii NRRL Y-1933]
MMDARPVQFRSFLHETLFVFTICMAQFLTQGSIVMSLSTMNIILDSFAQKGDIQDGEKVWFMGSFALTVGTFILISGKLGDTFGLKKMFIIGWGWCCIWSLITGISTYSNSLVFFIICRAFQGIGFAILLPCAMGIAGKLYSPGKRKNLVFGCVGASGPSGAALVCLLAAVVGEKTTWSWEFYLLSISLAIFGILAFIVVPTDEPLSHGSIWKTFNSKFDSAGSCLGVCGLILLNFVWNQGPIVGFSKVYIIVLLIISVLLIIAFFYYELNLAKEPLLPKSIFHPKIGLVLASLSFGWGSFGIWQYYYWNSILNLRGYSAIEGGLTYIPFLVLGIIAAFSCSVIISKIKPSFIMLAASIAFMCGCIMLSIMPIDQSFFQISLGQMFLLAWGMDLSFPAASLILSDFLPSHQQGMAGSLVSTMINYSVSLFLGIGTTVETNVKSSGTDVLTSYRAATYFGIAVAGLAVVSSCIFILVQYSSSDSAGTFHLESPLTSDVEKIDSTESPTFL